MDGLEVSLTPPSSLPVPLGTTGRIWSLFKSLNYSWLNKHSLPFIQEPGPVEAAAQCALRSLIGLKVAKPLNKLGQLVPAASFTPNVCSAVFSRSPMPPLHFFCPPVDIDVCWSLCQDAKIRNSSRLKLSQQETEIIKCTLIFKLVFFSFFFLSLTKVLFLLF